MRTVAEPMRTGRDECLAIWRTRTVTGATNGGRSLKKNDSFQ